MSRELENFITIDNQENAELYELSIRMMRRLLQIFGMWPLTSKSYPKTQRYFLNAVATFFLTFFLVPFCLHMFVIVKEFTIRIRLLGPLSFCLMGIHKFISVLLKKGEIRECLFWMAKDFQMIRRDFERKIMMENIKSSRLYLSICAICMYGSGLGYSVIFTLVQEPVVIGNVTYRQLCYPSYFVFFNPQVRPVFDVIFTMHVFCAFTLFTMACTVCSIAIVFTTHVCGQISIASFMLENLTEEFDQRIFKKIIEKHLRSLKFASKSKRLLNSMFFVEIMGCTLNMCLLGYYFITEYNPSKIGPYIYCLLWVSFTFNIFILCYISDRLSEKCASIGNAAYSIDWSRLTSRQARDLILIVASSQRPVVLTAGKMFRLSIPTFSRVLKSAFTYLNMLRTITAKSN